MNSTSNDPIKKQEEACTHRYLTDCKHIESKQDNIKRQRRLLEEIEEQLTISSSKAFEYYHNYAHSNDRQLYQLMNTSQCQIRFSQAETQKQFAGYHEEMVIEDRKLAALRDERDKQYKDELGELKHERPCP